MAPTSVGTGGEEKPAGTLSHWPLTFPQDHQWQSALIEAARDTKPVSGLTHNYYRYPARFSPRFVRAAIEAFTAPGNVVLDPFVGGGTTLVEALALGRRSKNLAVYE
jgi:DNA modification methylase